MKYSEIALDSMSQEFLNDATPYMRKLLEKYSVVYFIEIKDFGHGAVPGAIVVEDANYNLQDGDKLVPLLIKYSSPDDTESGGIYFMNNEDCSKFEVLCRRE